MYSKLLVKSVAVCVAVSIVGCSSYSNKSPFPTIDAKAQASLDAPINCATAKQDLVTIQNEKASVGKQILSGVRAVMPIAAVAGLLMGDYSDRAQVATGQYNDDIEAKMAKIRETCGVN